MTETPIYPHDPIEEIQPDVFMVRGAIKLNALMTITRNMADGSPRGRADARRSDPSRAQTRRSAWKSLGSVKRVLRLGSMHGVDDPVLHGPLRRGALGAGSLGGPSRSRSRRSTWDESTPLPFPDAGLFRFEGTEHSRRERSC